MSGITVTVTNTLGPLWGSAEDFAEMTDEHIIEIVRDDVFEFFDEAEWKITRSEKAEGNDR